MRLLALSLLLALCATASAWAEELPQAEIGQTSGGFVADQSAAVVGEHPADGGKDAAATAEHSGLIEIHSSGYSRFEIGDDGHILVVYTGGVDFNYLGYALSANELHFDQAARTASLNGDVRITSADFTLTTQQVVLDGAAGTGTISGHIVGSLPKSGIRFEAEGAQLTFPPESDQPRMTETQLVLSGNVVLITKQGATLRTDQIAFDGSTHRFSSAPFTLLAGLPGEKGGPVQPLQITGTAFGGTLTDKGELSQVDVLGLLAVSTLGKLSAAHAVATPSATGWRVEVSGEPVRIEYDGPLQMKLQGQKREVGPVQMEAPLATLELDSAGLKTAALSGGVTVAAAGNRLALASVSVDRRATGLALSAGGVSLGLDLARLTGIKPVDLSDLIK